MVAVPLALATETHREQVAPAELGQDPTAVLASQGGVAELAVQAGQQRRAGHEVAQFAGQLPQDLLGEVGEPARARLEQARQGVAHLVLLRSLEGLEQDLQAGRPALGAAHDEFGQLGVELRSGKAGLEEGGGLVGPEGQVDGPQLGQRSLRAQLHRGDVQRFARGEDEGVSRGQIAHETFDEDEHLLRSRCQLHVVEDQRGAAVDVPQHAHRLGQIAVGVVAAPRRAAGDRGQQVIPEDGGIGVHRVEGIPGDGPRAGGDAGRQQGGLAEPGARRDRHEAALPPVVPEGLEPRARQVARGTGGRRQFAGYDRLRHVGPSQRSSRASVDEYTILEAGSEVSPCLFGTRYSRKGWSCGPSRRRRGSSRRRWRRPWTGRPGCARCACRGRSRRDRGAW